MFPPFGIYVVGMYQPGSPMCAQKRRELEPTARKNNCFLRLKTIGRQWGGGGLPLKMRTRRRDGQQQVVIGSWAGRGPQ